MFWFYFIKETNWTCYTITNEQYSSLSPNMSMSVCVCWCVTYPAIIAVTGNPKPFFKTMVIVEHQINSDNLHNHFRNCVHHSLIIKEDRYLYLYKNCWNLYFRYNIIIIIFLNIHQISLPAKDNKKFSSTVNVSTPCQMLLDKVC